MQKLARPASNSLRPVHAVPHRTGPVGSDEHVTIFAVSMRDTESGVRTNALRMALGLAFAGPALGPRVVLLPGRTGTWPATDAAVVDLCRQHGAAVLFERSVPNASRWTAYDPGGRPLGVEIEQWIVDSAQADREPLRVDDILRRSKRGGAGTVSLAGVEVGLLCCGENNVLRCAQSNGNAVSVRHHPEESLFDHVPVVLNGAHTRMGNWPKMTKRFEYLSRGARFAFFITNNSRGPGSPWNGSVRLYFDGALLADGGGVVHTAQGIDALVVEDDLSDRFRGLVIVCRGSLLKPR